MKYSISCRNPLTHYLQIKAEFVTEPYSRCIINLPLWRPGRYEAANYAKNLRGLKFTSGTGDVLAADRKRVSSWEVTAGSDGTVIAIYEYFAFRLDAGSSWADEKFIYINFINCLMYEAGSAELPCEVDIDIPPHFRVATALQQVSHGQFTADSYYTLADSPLLAAETLHHQQYHVEGTAFNIWSWGYSPSSSVLSDFQKFTGSQINMLGEFPGESYHFLLLFLPFKFYHGVEHGNSTVICLGPSAAMNSPEMIDQLLGVSSHELFHAWNIIRIRPKELFPYRFNDEVFFPTGFVAEGFTTYYGDLFLVRSNVRDIPWYLEELAKLIRRHLDNPGRLALSVVDSSYDLWIDGYQKGAPGRKSSIYVEGAVSALMLDLIIRRNTNGKRSLDDVVKTLFQEYAMRSRGYSLEDVRQISADCAGQDLNEFFDSYILGTTDKTTLLKELLLDAGIIFTLSPSENMIERYFGLRVMESEDLKKVIQIFPGSVGEKYFSLDDTIESINGEPFTGNELGILDGINTFVIGRMGRRVEIKIMPESEIICFPVPNLTLEANLNEEQEKRLTEWL